MQPDTDSKDHETHISLEKKVSVRERLKLWESTIHQRKENAIPIEQIRLKRQNTIVGTTSFHKKFNSFPSSSFIPVIVEKQELFVEKPANKEKEPSQTTTLDTVEESNHSSSNNPSQNVQVETVSISDKISNTRITEAQHPLEDFSTDVSQSNISISNIFTDNLEENNSCIVEQLNVPQSEESTPTSSPSLWALKKLKERKRADSANSSPIIEEIFRDPSTQLEGQQEQLISSSLPIPSSVLNTTENSTVVLNNEIETQADDTFLKTDEVKRLKRFSSVSGSIKEPTSAAFLAYDLKSLSNKTEKDVQQTYLKNFRKSIFNDSTLKVLIDRKKKDHEADSEEEEEWETFDFAKEKIGFESNVPQHSTLYFDSIYPTLHMTSTFAQEEETDLEGYDDTFCISSNALLEEEYSVLNPLYEEEVYIRNALFEKDTVILNPLFNESRGIDSKATNVSKEIELIRTLRSKLEIKDRYPTAFKCIPKCFTGSNLVDVILQKGKQRWIRLDAIAMAQQIMDRLIFKNAEEISDGKFKDCETSYYRFTEDFYHKSWLNTLLSKDKNSSKTPRTPRQNRNLQLGGNQWYEEALYGNVEIIRQLQMILSEIIEKYTFRNDNKSSISVLDKYFKPHLQLFDYTNFAASSSYAQLQHVAFLMQFLNPLQIIGKQERLAFFINLYNIMFLHGLVVYGRPTNLLLRDKFNKTVKYVVGNLVVSLDDIKHVILQCGKRESWIPTSTSGSSMDELLQWDSKSECEGMDQQQEEEEDSTRGVPFNPLLHCSVFLAQQRTDPRIHFALITGCLSSPPLCAFDANSVDLQLTQQTSLYLQHEGLQVDLQDKMITIPQVMNWYIEDYPDPHLEQRIRWMCPFLTIEQQNKIHILLDQNRDDYGAKFYTYNWSLNHISLRESPHLIGTILRLENQHNLFGMLRNTTHWKRYKMQWEHEEEMFYQSIQIPLEQTIGNPAYRRYFVSYCKLEHSAENIMFWIQVERYKHCFDNEEDMESIRDTAWKIYTQFLEQDKAPMEVNVSKESVEQVRSSIVENHITHRLFDQVQQLVGIVMQDTYSRFIISPFYKQLVRSIFGDEEDLDEEELDDDSDNSASVSSGDRSQETLADRKPRKMRSGTIFDALKFDSASANEDVTNWTPMAMARYRLSTSQVADEV